MLGKDVGWEQDTYIVSINEKMEEPNKEKSINGSS